MENSIKKLDTRYTINKTFKFIKNNLMIIIFTAVVIFGMMLGGILVNSINLSAIKKLDILFCSDFDNRITQPLWYTFVSSLSSSFFFWAVMVGVSLSFLGPIMIPFILLFKSTGLGLTAGYLYIIYNIKGIAFYIMVLLPGLFISSVGFIFMSIFSTKFSLKVSSKFLPNCQEQKLWPDLVEYIRKSGGMLLILVFSSLADVAFIGLFSKIFSF